MQRERQKRPKRRLIFQPLEPRAVLVADPLAMNIAPSFTEGADLSVLEDSGPRLIADWATDISPGDVAEVGQSVTFEVQTDRPELFAALPTISPLGVLAFEPKADASGIATVSLQLVDDGGTANGGADRSSVETFTITITPVNDRPTFDATDPPAVDEDTGAHTVKFWALFEPGAADELNQRGPIYEVVGISRPEMFAVLPKVSKTLGTLTYKLKPDAFGTTTIDVNVRDSGGAANGGVNTSAVQTFTLTVNGVNDPPQANPDFMTMSEDGRDATFQVLANDSILPDVDETLSITAIATPKYGTASIVAGGTRIQYTPPTNFVGRDSLEYTISDGNGGFDTATLTIDVLNRPDEIMVVAAGDGAAPEVVVANPASGQELFRFLAYNQKFRGGVRVATGDVTGDGAPDIITGAGPGGGPHVRVFDGVSGQPLSSPVGSFMAFSPFFTGGVFVASGDVNGDGLDDVIVSADEGGGPHVRVFSATDGAELMSFYAYAPNFAGGVRVAAADLNSDGLADIITGAGAGGGPHVRAISGQDGTTLKSFYAYDPAFTGGVYVAAGDVDGGGLEDIITGAGAGGGPHVRAFGGADNKIKANFFAYEGDYLGGVPVAVTSVNDADGLNGAKIIVGHGLRDDGQVRLFTRNGTLVSETDPLPNSDGAVSVAGSSFAIRGPGSDSDGITGIVITIGDSSPGSDVTFAEDPGFSFGAPVPITDADVDSLRAAVIARWELAGLDPRFARLFHFVEVHLTDLSSTLGYLDNNDIYLDSTFGAAASPFLVVDIDGNATVLQSDPAPSGWFIDPTPLDDAEFTASPDGSLVATAQEAIGKVDLVSVLSNLFGELLGVEPIDAFTISSSNPRNRSYPPGVRHPITPDQVDQIFADES
jgi:hypothetical protein